MILELKGKKNKVVRDWKKERKEKNLDKRKNGKKKNLGEESLQMKN